MNFGALEYYIKETLTNIARNKLMSFTTVLIVAIAFFILGSFAIICLSINKVVKRNLQQFHLRIFIKEGLPEYEIYRLQAKILKDKSVLEAKFIPKAEAWRKFKEHYNPKIDLSELGVSNPLRDEIAIRVNAPKAIKPLATRLQKIKSVAKVSYGGVVLDYLLAFYGFLKQATLIIATVLSVGIISIIYTTIRLTIFYRRREIRIMQLVGASHNFIRLPFILEGIFEGLIGTAAAALTILVLYNTLADKISQALPFLKLTISPQELSMILLILLFAGAIIGAFGSFFSIRRHLKYVY